MNRTEIFQTLPAGLEDEHIEIYAHGKHLMAVYQGKKILFVYLPEDIKEIFMEDMLANKEAMKVLVTLNLDSHAMLIQYVWCNYGGFSSIADMKDGKLNSEYWDCQVRGKCPYEGKLCKSICIEDKDVISQRELQVIILICDGKPDKQIADELNIAIPTAQCHRRNIEKKLGAACKVDVAVWAFKNGISND